jgi:hypothetical protein
MLQLLLREPLVCFYPFVVLPMLAWAIWTRPRHSLYHSCPGSAVLPRGRSYDEIRGGALMPHRSGLRSSAVAAAPPLFDRLYAAVAADYDALFEKMNSRIQRQSEY